ncbi:MAG: hypothetical protein H5U19_14415 [Rhodobacteraceae bacterium]|nr:hypothetical protein [Paracoccaceae bacterium]
MRYVVAALLLLPTAALAHDGAHHHPHGVEGLWIGTAAVLAAGAVGYWLARGRK